ncbi:MAG: HAD family hydrolase, partial [Bacteroides sp.]|nr:HAD family hydrolase [Bacteroides sp.]
MIDKKGIEAIAFDFGGTLDSPFKHWFTIYLEAYSKVLDTTVEKEQLLDAYIKTEQMLEREGLIASDFDLYQT